MTAAPEPMKLILSNPWHRDGSPTVCDVYLNTWPVRAAWVWERADNPGVSITNAAEHVYMKLRDLFGPCFVIECYGPGSYRVPIPGDNRYTFDLVTLGDDAEPSWHRLGTCEVDALEALAAFGEPS